MDEVDKKIIARLQEDGRTSLEDLSKVTGFTSMGTKKRLEKLINNGTMKISALLNAEALGLHLAVVMLEMENAEATQNLLERFKECPRIIQIFKTMGGFNLIAIVLAENRETLESISMEKCSMKMQQRNTSIRILPYKRHIFFAYLQIRENLATKKQQALLAM